MPVPIDGKKRVLIVEDDQATREAFALVLGQAGYRTQTATHGQEALDLLEGDPPPSVIVLDLMMPVMDGYQFRRRQASDGRLAGIPVIVCSAEPRPAAEKALALGAREYLAKPIDPPALVEAVARYC